MKFMGKSAQHEGEWSASSPWRFNPAETDPRTHCIGDWVAPSVGVNVVQKRKSCIAGNQTRAVQPITRRYTDWGIPNPTYIFTCVCIVRVQRAAYYEERRAHNSQTETFRVYVSAEV
jgi:hypothetical protein